jgi:hypothetical protein
MTYWIEFESKSHLWKGVRYSTNITTFPPLILERKRDVLSVFSHEHCIAQVAGTNEMKMGESVFKPKTTSQKVWFLKRLVGLISDDFSLLFEPHQSRSANAGIRISSEHLPQEQYIVTNKLRLFFPRTKTRVRIESKEHPQSLHLMIGCLAYFWNYFEHDRTYD